MNDSTLGQYYPGESVLHRLDPRTKFIGTIIFLITLFIKKDGYGYFFAVLYLMVVIMCAKIPIKVLLRGLKPILFLLTATFIFQTLTSQGGEVLLQLWIFKITYKGIYKGATMSLRLLLMVLGAAMLSYTTTPNAISDGLERLLQPLTKIKIPVHEFAFMTLIAIKFIPILMEESDKIMKAQMARGIEFDEGTLIQKGKNLIPILVPIFISTFHRANELGEAMDSRCYRGGEHRTTMNPLNYKGIDWLSYSIFFCYFVISCLISIRMMFF